MKQELRKKEKDWIFLCRDAEQRNDGEKKQYCDLPLLKIRILFHLNIPFQYNQRISNNLMSRNRLTYRSV